MKFQFNIAVKLNNSKNKTANPKIFLRLAVFYLQKISAYNKI